jgi:hypothetical protein
VFLEKVFARRFALEAPVSKAVTPAHDEFATPERRVRASRIGRRLLAGHLGGSEPAKRELDKVARPERIEMACPEHVEVVLEGNPAA